MLGSLVSRIVLVSSGPSASAAFAPGTPGGEQTASSPSAAGGTE